MEFIGFVEVVGASVSYPIYRYSLVALTNICYIIKKYRLQDTRWELNKRYKL